jgi:hypothetical protein
MTLNAIGLGRDAGIGYGSAAGGLRAFDDLSRSVSARRDAVVRDVAQKAAARYPEPGHLSPAVAVGTVIGSAVAAFAGSEAGRAAIEHAISAASSALKGIFGGIGGAAQLPLPFE